MSPTSHRLRCAVHHGLGPRSNSAKSCSRKLSFAPQPPTGEIVVGSVALATPFFVAAVLFGERIWRQRSCIECNGTGLVSHGSGGRFLRRCRKCGGFLPWQSWKRFFLGWMFSMRSAHRLQSSGDFLGIVIQQLRSLRVRFLVRNALRYFDREGRMRRWKPLAPELSSPNSVWTEACYICLYARLAQRCFVFLMLNWNFVAKCHGGIETLRPRTFARQEQFLLWAVKICHEDSGGAY